LFCKMALIEVKNLSKTYSDDGSQTPAVCGVSFDIKDGEFVAIMGPSGSGKSTLLHVLGFLDRHSSGEYRFNDKTIDDYSDEELAQVRNEKLGFIFQAFNLLPRTTVLDNVKLPLLYSGLKESLWKETAEKAIDLVGLSHRLDYDSSQLSGGERQRVAIARALVNNPRVIFADEPTGNLDSNSGKVVMKILQDLNKQKGHTVILITHDPNIATYANRMITIRDGKIESDKSIAKTL